MTTVESADEAMTNLQTQLPDLILMDVVMPGQNGFQFTRQLSKDPVTQNIPVIMCTSKNQQTDRIWGLRQGAATTSPSRSRPRNCSGKIAALG